MARLPTPGGDDGKWGDILNEFLLAEHETNGLLKIRTDGTLDKKIDTTDTRLTDSRSPTDGSVTDAKITSGGLSPSKITGTAVTTDDSRLSAASDLATHAALSSTAHSGTHQMQIRLDTPDSSGNGYPALSTNNGFSSVRRVVPAFTKLVDGTWEGSIRIPQGYTSTPVIICSFVANSTSGAIRVQVSTSVIAPSVSEDIAYTAETATNTTVPGTAKQRFDITTPLTTTLVAGSTLNVKVARIGSNIGDTLAVDALLWECVFQYFGGSS